MPTEAGGRVALSRRRVHTRCDLTHTKALFMSSYYESEDLAKFGQIGEHGKALADEFFKYYGMVTGADGALTRREKALIALAVSHAERCPYCIEAYTTACLETGANPEQMMEAVHVAAAMKAGVTLVHAVQMKNQLDKLVL
jgi:alkylhydroperoxidase/carboxymuconolactone decarboxylase family protein